ncbi:MAG: transporter substrate-binding domain-containing protein [Anaerolineales bacterium]|nr:transporter substrate-binding domain-containing protein [Anaerolineales bacterium]
MQTNGRHLLFLALLALLLTVMLPSAVQAQAATPAPTPAPADDLERVKSAGKIVIGTAANYPPFEYYNSDFQLDGFDIALMKQLAQRMGVKPEFQDYAFDGLLDALQLGQIDVAIAAISITPDRQQRVDFTNIYYYSSDAALVQSSFSKSLRSPSDFKGLKIGVERGSTFNAWAQQNIVEQDFTPQANLVTYDDMDSMVRDFSQRRHRRCPVEQLPADAIIQRFPELKIGGARLNTQQLAIAARKGSSLIERINRALVNSQADGSFAKLVNEYLSGAAGSTPSATPTPIPPVPTVAPPPTSTPPAKPPCYQGMTLEAHVNLNDNNMTSPPVMAPGQQFTKRWRVRNSGTCAWTTGFRLIYVNGNSTASRMGGANEPIGIKVEPGQTVDLAVDLRAPKAPGLYQGFWQLSTPQQYHFGQVLPVGIQVPQPAPPPPPPPNVLDPHLRSDASEVFAGQCTTIRWDVDNVNAVYFIDAGSIQGVGGHDWRTVCPGKTSTYKLRVVARNNTITEFPITIRVTGGAEATISFTADRKNIDAGQCTTLRWKVENVNAVYLNNEGVAGVSSRETCPSRTTDYQLRVIKRNGAEERRNIRITVNAAPPPPPPGGPIISSFYGDRNNIGVGQCVNFTWRTSGSQGINFYRSGIALLQAGPTSGGLQDCPGSVGVYDYTLDAYNNAAHTSQAVTVQVR